MSVICHNFVQNTWKKDLCSNCFKSSAEHKHAETRNNEILNFINSGVSSPLTGSNGEMLGRYMSQATTIYQSRNLLNAQKRTWPTLILDQKTDVKGQKISLSAKLPVTCMTENIKHEINGCKNNEGDTLNDTIPDPGEMKECVDENADKDSQNEDFQGKKENKLSVKFYEDEAMVIGYGGNDYDPNEPSWELGSDDGDEWILEMMDDTTEERIITRLTKENTEFNSDKNNLLKDPAKEEVHVMNVKNAISKLEGLRNKVGGVADDKNDVARQRSQPPTTNILAPKTVPTNSKLDTRDVKKSKDSSKVCGSEKETVAEEHVTEGSKIPMTKKTNENILKSDSSAKTPSKSIEEGKYVNGIADGNHENFKENVKEVKKYVNCEEIRSEASESEKLVKEPPLYSVVTKPPKSVETSSQKCTCPENFGKIKASTNIIEESHYKVPTENNKTVVPDSEIAEFLNYDIPARSNPDADEYNVIDEGSDTHYDVVKSEPQMIGSVEPAEEHSITPELPPELPTTPPPIDQVKTEKSTREQIAAIIGITPKPQSSFLHNICPSKSKDKEPVVKSVDDESNSCSEYANTSITSEEGTTTTNPIYTPAEDIPANTNSSLLEMAEKLTSNKNFKVKPKIPVKPCNIGNKENQFTPNVQNVVETEEQTNCSAITDNVYDDVECPNSEANFVTEGDDSNFDIYQDMKESDQVKNFNGREGCDGDVSRQRNGSNKRQAPLPPNSQSSVEDAPVPLPVKKSQRHSMTFPSVGSTPSQNKSKPKSNSLGNFHRVKIHCSKSSNEGRYQKDEKELKPKKGKFWRKIFNKFNKDDEVCAANNRNSVHEEQNQKLIRNSMDVTTPKKVKLEIIHPIDFEHSGGPQIIESPAITTSEDGLPSVVDCSSPASSVCSGIGHRMSDDAATSSDSGGNYESVGDDEDSSTGHNGYGSHDEQLSDYFEASNSDCSTGEMMPSSGARSSKPMPPTRSKILTPESRIQHQAPSRPPPPKISTRSSDEPKNQSQNELDNSPNYTNTREMEFADGKYYDKTAQHSPGETLDEETKRRRAPAPPLKNINNEEPTYQNLNEVNLSVKEGEYYEPLNIHQSGYVDDLNEKKFSSPVGGNNIENNNSSNDTKSTDSGFIEYTKFTKEKKKSSVAHDQTVGHLYEKIESNNASSRSSSPNDSTEPCRNRERNSSGFSDSSFKISGKRLASLTLEENYGNIVCTNHETLACILENVQRVKHTHPLLKKANSLKWSDFELQTDELLVTYKKSRVMLSARYRMNPDLNLTLMVSKDGLCLSPPGNAPFIIHPLVQFTDLVPAKLFAGKESGEMTVQASVWVLDNIKALSIPNLFLGKDNIDEKQVHLIMLQLITALKFLQAHGIEELDSVLDNFLVNTDNNHLFIFGDSSVQPQHMSGRSKDMDCKLSLCHAAIASMLYLLRSSNDEEINQISEDSLAILDSWQNEFLPIANILLKEKAVSLSQAKSLLEYMLWGPPESSFDRQEFCTPEELEIVIQRWLDQERATFLSNLIRTVNNSNMQSLLLSAYEEYKLIFLVRTSAKILREASVLLEPEVTTF